MHIVEVSDSARDRLQGLHHCFFGWRTFSRLQLLRSVSHCLNVSSSFVLSRQGTGLANLSWSAAVCSAVLARISLCNTLKIAQLDDKSAPRRYGNILSSMLKQISCASCQSAAPCLDKSAGCPRTLFTSSVSNSGLITFAHVLNPIVNQSCHAVAGSKPRDPVGAGIFASLTRENIQLATSSQHPSQELCRRVLRFSCVPPLLLLQAAVGLSGLFESLL